jgi:hypothetical protein
MNASGHGNLAAHEEPGDFDALLAAISDGIEALVAWDIAAFQSAAQRQSSICDSIASNSRQPKHPPDAGRLQKVRELNRVYDRLLQHSIRWTRALRAILQAGGHQPSSHASVHFRG